MRFPAFLPKSVSKKGLLQGSLWKEESMMPEHLQQYALDQWLGERFAASPIAHWSINGGVLD